MIWRLLLALASATFAMWPLAQSQPPDKPLHTSLPTIDINSGPLPRTNTIVCFQLPSTVRGEPLQLRSPDNTTLPLQLTRFRNACFIVDSLAANETRHYVIEPALYRPDASWLATTSVAPDHADLSIDRRATLRYQMEKSQRPSPNISPAAERGGYLHPVRTASGAIVTGDYPPEHPSQHGIWTAWPNTLFQGRSPDFWNTDRATGTVEFEGLLESWSGPVHTGLRSRHRFVDTTSTTPITALTEAWEITLYAVGLQQPRPFRMFDVVSRLETARTENVVLRESVYGGLGVRGHHYWNGNDSSTRFLTSEGTNRTNSQTSRPRWCYIGGIINGSYAGIAILSDPLNVRSPEPIYIDPTEPFFGLAPTRLGAITISSDRPLLSRYRFITIDGPPDATWLEQRWQDFANPVSVRTQPSR